MPQSFDQEKNQSPLEEPKPAQEVPVNSAVSARHNRWRRLILPVTTVAAIGTLAIYPAINRDNHNQPSGSNSAGKPSDVHRLTTVADVQASREPASFFGEVCFSQTHTIKSGDTIFSLSSAGMHGDPEFMDAVFAWNLSYVHRQAKKNKALANLNDLQIGKKVKIYGDCVSYEPVFESYKYNPNSITGQATPEGDVRELVYQDYEGTDAKIHHLVTVDYQSDPQGKLLGVKDCQPSPECFDYVAAAPSHPPQDYYP